MAKNSTEQKLEPVEFGYDLEVPQTVADALSSPQKDQWRRAMQDEYDSLMENNTWKLEELPSDRRAIRNKWVFALKKDAEGRILKFKARLVAKGFSQVEGIDYEETFAPVVRYNTLRILICLSASLGLKITQMDAVTAFLNGELKEEIYMDQPEAFGDQTARKCKLIKSMYGLKQSSRVWNQTLNDVLINAGLERLKTDQCIYSSIEKDKKSVLLVAIYVDDILIFSNDEKRERMVVEALNKNFKMKFMGDASVVLGIRIERNVQMGTITLDQQKYIDDMLRRFKMDDCNPVSTPIDVNQKLSASMSGGCDADVPEEERIFPYREAVGSLLFLAMITRPDISFAVNLLSRFQERPLPAHWKAVKRVFRYLKGTAGLKLIYGQRDEKLNGFCDADWAADSDERKSTTGYVFTMSGGAVSWRTKKQPTVVLSTTEAEYMAIVGAVQEGMWIRSFLIEIGTYYNQGETPVLQIYADNKGAIQVAQNNSFSERTKHIDIKLKFIKEKMDSGDVVLNYLPTDSMPADILTKGCPMNKILKHRAAFGVNNYISN